MSATPGAKCPACLVRKLAAAPTLRECNLFWAKTKPPCRDSKASVIISAGKLCPPKNVAHTPICLAKGNGDVGRMASTSIWPSPNLRRATAGRGAAPNYTDFFYDPLWLRSHAKQAMFAEAPESNATSLRPAQALEPS